MLVMSDTTAEATLDKWHSESLSFLEPKNRHKH